MKRRTFFGLSALLLTSKMAMAHGKTKFEINPALDLCDELLCYLKHPSEAASIGYDYLMNHPDLNDTMQLIKSVGVDTASSGQFVSKFEAQREHDFTIGNTVIVDGWVLSNAEISLCAIASLTHSQV